MRFACASPRQAASPDSGAFRLNAWFSAYFCASGSIDRDAVASGDALGTPSEQMSATSLNRRSCSAFAVFRAAS